MRGVHDGLKVGAQVTHIYEESIGSILSAWQIYFLQWTNEVYNTFVQVNEIRCKYA